MTYDICKEYIDTAISAIDEGNVKYALDVIRFMDILIAAEGVDRKENLTDE